ncbi:MAG: SDR family oxidoreductase [Holophagales bacterium]|nr:MAG: SDR family oxidoreductase [Holophagales bacterium]
MSKIFFTGFPGFLGVELVPRVLARAPQSEVVCLIQSKFAPLAARRVAEIERRDAAFAGRIRLVEGDITQPGLGLPADALAALATDTSEIFHLAAVYDLSVRREVAVRVNVDGTRNLLDFAARCPALARFQYVSTCYVSGRYPGIFREEDLIKGQVFNNFYEETKFLAEVEVRERMEKGLPATIYRPAVVVGDSRTGETQKYDGPYYVMRWLLRQPGIALLPVVGDTHRSRLNLVPRDFVVEAIDYLSGVAKSLGKTYQLADPEALTIDEVIQAMGKATGRMVLRLPLPLSVAKNAIDHVPGVYALLQIPSSSVDYFVHPTYYATGNATADLAEAGLKVPALTSYLPVLVSFMKRHPEIASDAMV